MRRLSVFLLLAAVILALASGCTPSAKPDLVPGEGPYIAPPNIGWVDGKIVVYVKNQGNATSTASTTRVIFSLTGSQTTVDLATPAINPGATVTLTPITPPVGWFNPDGDLIFTVDVLNAVTESNEGNNQSGANTIVG